MVYARDIKKEIRNNTFFGKGFEKLLKQAEKEGRDLVVGNFLDIEEMYIE